MTTADGSRITKFTGSQQGPAFMLSLKLDSGTKVDIDLVAAFSFEPQSFQKFPGKWIIPENDTRQFWPALTMVAFCDFCPKIIWDKSQFLIPISNTSGKNKGTII